MSVSVRRKRNRKAGNRVFIQRKVQIVPEKAQIIPRKQKKVVFCIKMYYNKIYIMMQEGIDKI